MPLFTVGHSNHTLEEFTALLQAAEVGLVVDVRKLTGSRAHPHFNDDVLAVALPDAGISYRQLPALAGRRPRAKDVPDEVNALWRNRSFHNYADWALGDEFRDGLDRLRTWGGDVATTVMCSEAVWWRCHRRIIADHLLAAGEEVSHIMPGPRLDAAALTPGAVVAADGSVFYPAGQ
ncbi:DUF488 family protein [Microbacterium sp. MC2]